MPAAATHNPISGYLKPGERVMWWQDRAAHRTSLNALIPIMFSACWTLVTLGSFTLTLWAALADIPGSNWMKPAASLFLTVVGIGMIAYSWREVRAVAPVSYIVTDRAALIIEHATPARVHRFGPDAISRRLVFADRIAFVDDVFDPRAHDMRSSFVGVENIEAAERALDRIARKIEKPGE